MSEQGDGPRGWVFWSGLALGWAILLFGVWTALRHAGSARPPVLAAWFVGLTLAHDLVLAPAVSALALFLGPRLPRRGRGAISAAAIVSGVLALLTLPSLLGDPAGNATLLPRDYPGGLAAALVVVWVVATIVFLSGRGWRRSR